MIYNKLITMKIIIMMTMIVIVVVIVRVNDNVYGAVIVALLL